MVVAPDDPLVAGMVDALNAAGFATFGPRANAAIIEGSKVFSKDLMQKYHIPTASIGYLTILGRPLNILRRKTNSPLSLRQTVWLWARAC